MIFAAPACGLRASECHYVLQDSIVPLFENSVHLIEFMLEREYARCAKRGQLWPPSSSHDAGISDSTHYLHQAAGSRKSRNIVIFQRHFRVPQNWCAARIEVRDVARMI